MGVKNMFSSIGFLFLAVTAALPSGSSASARCESLEHNGQDGRASCKPCNVGEFEVHVINLASADYTGTVNVDVSLRTGTPPRPVRLVLISVVKVNWFIRPTNLVDLQKVVTITTSGAHSTINYSRVYEGLMPTHVSKDALAIAKDPILVEEFLKENNIGQMTSYEIYYNSISKVEIRLGECGEHTPDILPSVNETRCLKSQQCLVQVDFPYAKQGSGCSGEQYITMYGSLFVGIVLCNSTRYKLLLSNLLRGPYLDIADRVPLYDQYGSDHCQMVGQTDESIPVTSRPHGTQKSCPGKYGFYRQHMDEDFFYGKICGDIQLPGWTERETPSWYECGNGNFPSNFKVLNASWSEPAAPKPQASSPNPGATPTGRVVPFAVGAAAGAVLVVVILLVAIIFLARRRRARGPRDSRRQGSQQPLREDNIRPPAELPPDAQIAQESALGNEYSYVGFQDIGVPNHSPVPSPVYRNEENGVIIHDAVNPPAGEPNGVNTSPPVDSNAAMASSKPEPQSPAAARRNQPLSPKSPPPVAKKPPKPPKVAQNPFVVDGCVSSIGNLLVAAQKMVPNKYVEPERDVYVVVIDSEVESQQYSE